MVYLPAAPGSPSTIVLETKNPSNGGAQRLVGVTVVALADPVDRPLLGGEVEARIDLVLAVGEEELHLHRCAAFACT